MAEKSSCSVCGKSGTISPSYTGSFYCKKHFHDLIEKRVRKDIRTHQPVDVKHVYCLQDTASVFGRLTLDLLRSIFGDQLQLRDKGILIESFCLEQYASFLFKEFLDGHLDNVQGFFPLRTVSIEDINALLDVSLSKGDYVHPLLGALEKVQPASLFSVLKTLEK